MVAIKKEPKDHDHEKEQGSEDMGGLRMKKVKGQMK